MTAPGFNQEELLAFLKERGFTIASDDGWEEENFIIMEKDGESFPLQLRSWYWFHFTVGICEDFGIEPPPEHKRYLVALREMNKRGDR